MGLMNPGLYKTLKNYKPYKRIINDRLVGLDLCTLDFTRSLVKETDSVTVSFSKPKIS